MDINEICAVCECYAGVTADYPFGETPRCYRVSGRIFAQVFAAGAEGALRVLLQDESVGRERRMPMLTLQCEPVQGDFYRCQYPGAVLRPYHCPPAKQPYANTVLLDGRVPDTALREMIDHAYRTALGKLPRYRRRELLAMEKQGDA